MSDNVAQLKQPPERQTSTSDGGGPGGLEARLRNVEERLAKLETRMESVATREDIEKLKVWILGIIVLGLPSVMFVLSRVFPGLFVAGS